MDSAAIQSFGALQSLVIGIVLIGAIVSMIKSLAMILPLTLTLMPPRPPTRALYGLIPALISPWLPEVLPLFFQGYLLF